MRFRHAFMTLVLTATLSFVVDSASAADPACEHDLTGLEVTGLLGEELGQIASVSGAPNSKDATVLVEASGMLDAGHRYFTLRRSQLGVGEDVDTVTAKATAADVLKLLRNDTQVAGR